MIVNIQMCHNTTICETISMVLGDIKILCTIKKEAQAISNTVEEEISTNMPGLPHIPNNTVQTSAV